MNRSAISIPFGIDKTTKAICHYKEVDKGQEVVCFMCDDPLVKCKGAKNREYLKHLHCIKEGSYCFEGNKQEASTSQSSIDVAYELFYILKNNEIDVIIELKQLCACCEVIINELKFSTKDIININKITKYDFSIMLVATEPFSLSIENTHGNSQYNIDVEQLRKNLTKENDKTIYRFISDKEKYCCDCVAPVQYYRVLRDATILKMYMSNKNQSYVETIHHFLAQGWLPAINKQLREDGLRFCPLLKTWWYSEIDAIAQRTIELHPKQIELSYIPLKMLIRKYGKPVKFIKECLKCNLVYGNKNYTTTQLCQCKE